MTAIRGIREAGFLVAVAAALAAVGATIWVTAGSGDFVTRFGMCLIIAGIVLSVTGTVAFSRAATSDAFAWLGKGPERDGGHDGGHDGGGRVLTSVGIFLFVSVPLIIIGILLLR
jgi:hypothetical protein